ncbi:MAG: hypothetical protein EP329_10465 [Deltaproteobacteria bacterium]|nr:MAG: hypothetical protein EP329_10465 [Deltaproteobacteria bacterium]
MRLPLLLASALALAACSGDPAVTADAADTGEDPGPVDTADPDAAAPDCAPYAYAFRTLVPGPCEPGYDGDLAALARRYERSFHVFSAAALGANADVGFALENTADRDAISAFLADSDGWDFAAATGRDPVAIATSTQKVTGLYAGVGIAADAFRYAVLRDQGYPADEVERARGFLLRGLEVLHIATEITGIPGGMVRSIGRRDLPGAGQSELVPLFDDHGTALPETKNNGAWRADNSAGGQYPELVWEDSCSRDMALGWVTAYGAAWEVIGDDATIAADVKARLRADAKAIGDHLRVVRDNGYDLELYDPDGRRTLHGCVNEHNFDCQAYVDFVDNGFHAVMALGMVGALAYASGDADLARYLKDDLIAARGLPAMLLEDAVLNLDTGYDTNFSGVNMTFGGALLALRYVDDAATRDVVREAVDTHLYHREGSVWEPVDMGQSLFDFVYAHALTGGSVFGPPTAAPDQDAVDRGVSTLLGFPSPPYWDAAVVHCPDATCDCDHTAVPEGAEVCTVAGAGPTVDVLGCRGRGCALIAAAPLPKRYRSPSNYEWRSSPYRINGGGDGSVLLPGVDFRFAYWLGRYLRVP